MQTSKHQLQQQAAKLLENANFPEADKRSLKIQLTSLNADQLKNLINILESEKNAELEIFQQTLQTTLPPANSKTSDTNP